MFPLGEMLKSSVRDCAKELNLHIHDKKDSTGICFIGERKFSDFLKNYIDINQGDIVDTEGNILGTHQGINFYTIGQRQGLGIGGLAQASDAPWYVVAKDSAANKLIIAQGNNHPALFNQRLSLDKIHWINPQQTIMDLQYRLKLDTVNHLNNVNCAQPMISISCTLISHSERSHPANMQSFIKVNTVWAAAL